MQTQRAAEGGHWYTREGEQVATVTGSKGQPVKPDLRHARKLDLAPGCTTIIKSAASPGLQVWKEKQVLLAALTLTRQPEETDEAFVHRVMEDASRQAREAAEAGTLLHAEIESAINSETASPVVCEVQECIGGQFGLRHWRTEMPCVSRFGYATKSDLSCVDGEGIVLDVKTKEGALTPQLWDEHLMQLAATREALGLPQAVCGIVFVRRDAIEAAVAVATEEEVQRGWRMFAALLRYWQAKNKFAPTWAEAVL